MSYVTHLAIQPPNMWGGHMAILPTPEHYCCRKKKTNCR